MRPHHPGLRFHAAHDSGLYRRTLRLHQQPAPNAKLRYQVITLGQQGGVEESASGQLDTQSVAGGSAGAPGRRTSSLWASLIARIYDVLPLACPSCGASMSIIAFVTDPVPVRSVLTYRDLPFRPPPLSPARAPPQGMFEFDQTGGFDPTDPVPVREFEFDQSLPDCDLSRRTTNPPSPTRGRGGAVSLAHPRIRSSRPCMAGRASVHPTLRVSPARERSRHI